MTQITIDVDDAEQFEQLVLQHLPARMQENPQIQELVLELARQTSADCDETDDHFYQLLSELRGVPT
jgi:hypothetical protein